ncbi:MAG: 2OG-Fe(II) oxygenase [Phycisphaeraceae bacterium]
MIIKIHKQLLSALGKIDRPGTFVASGEVEPVLAGLEVAGVGTVAMPLIESQAALLKKESRQAPYGKGIQTRVDTDVRRVWEIDAQQVSFANPQWPQVLEQVVSAARNELGLEKQELDAQLYKLLLYEKGSFFLPHRDGEKRDRMVATLIIALPSAHEGGELVVRHEGRERTIDFAPLSRFQTQFAAFYCDCEHEVKPVTGGYRLALVYNLSLKRAKECISAPSSGEHVAAVARILSQWNLEEGTGEDAVDMDTLDDVSPLKAAVLLDHKYSQAGLTYDALKGIDRAKADVLFEAARQAGFDAYLALVTHWQSGWAEPTGGYGRSRYGSREDEDDEHEMGEVSDEDLKAEHFSDAAGNALALGKIELDESEIVSRKPLTDGKPDKEDFEGYTGNAGMTLERWYHRAAVMLWPTASRFSVLCDAGVASSLGGLEQMVRELDQATPAQRATQKELCIQFARRIIESWPEAPKAFRYKDDAIVPMLPLLIVLDDPTLVAAWLNSVLAANATVDPGATLGDACEHFGWLVFNRGLLNVFESTTHETLERNALLLADMALRDDTNADRRELCTLLAAALQAGFEQWNPDEGKHHWDTKAVDAAALLSGLVKTYMALNTNELLARLTTHVIQHPKTFDITTLQIPALLSLEPWLKDSVHHPRAPLDRWLTAIANDLETRASSPPRKPTDWRREAATGCTCADCKALSQFLDDPKQESLRLPLNQTRRQHLHQIIDRRQLDATHATERRGRPFTLVCNKTTATYDRAVQAHQLDLVQLKGIRALMNWHQGLATKSDRKR